MQKGSKDVEEKVLEEFVQINLEVDGDPTVPQEVYTMREETTNKVLEGSPKIIYVNLPYYSETCYNKGVDKMSVGEKLLAMIGSDSMEKVKEISAGDKDLERIAKQVEKFQKEAMEQMKKANRKENTKRAFAKAQQMRES